MGRPQAKARHGMKLTYKFAVLAPKNGPKTHTWTGPAYASKPWTMAVNIPMRCRKLSILSIVRAGPASASRLRKMAKVRGKSSIWTTTNNEDCRLTTLMRASWNTSNNTAFD